MDRVGRFVLVGALGTGVQLGTIAALSAAMPYADALATVIGVEAAVLHNFVWHWRWTWRDRSGPAQTSWPLVMALARFHCATALCSMAGNVLIAVTLTRWLGWPLLAANLVAIGVCSAGTFALSDRLVFVPSSGDRPSPRGPASRGLLLRLSIDRLTRFGGQPCLLRPRREPIEPQF